MNRRGLLALGVGAGLASPAVAQVRAASPSGVASPRRRHGESRKALMAVLIREPILQLLRGNLHLLQVLTVVLGYLNELVN